MSCSPSMPVSATLSRSAVHFGYSSCVSRSAVRLSGTRARSSSASLAGAMRTSVNASGANPQATDIRWYSSDPRANPRGSCAAAFAPAVDQSLRGNVAAGIVIAPLMPRLTTTVLGLKSGMARATPIQNRIAERCRLLGPLKAPRKSVPLARNWDSNMPGTDS